MSSEVQVLALICDETFSSFSSLLFYFLSVHPLSQGFAICLLQSLKGLCKCTSWNLQLPGIALADCLMCACVCFGLAKWSQKYTLPINLKLYSCHHMLLSVSKQLPPRLQHSLPRDYQSLSNCIFRLEFSPTHLRLPTAVVPNLFSTRDRFPGRLFFQGPGLYGG